MKSLKKYLNKRERVITALLRDDVLAYDPITVHSMRVEIKKMSAFLDLLEYTARDFERKKIFKPFKAIFRQAGRLRELQVEEAMLKKYAFRSILTDYRKDLKKLRLQEQRNLSEVISNKLGARVKRNYFKLDAFAREADKKKVYQYLKRKRKKIERLVTRNSLKTSELHKLRKRIKELNYNQSSVGMKRPVSRSVKVDALPALLGKWHDCQVIIRHLKKVTSDRKKHPGEVARLKEVTKDISADRDFLLNKIEKSLIASEFYRAVINRRAIETSGW